ncbi:hypothetical protein Fmac_017373 [Flemingia macrophylla]|uniref:Uncharacterized protein n=1 Tax=Flemingia macrophylla TaxID=520843 RepID=A0ABD1M2C5_9FABA
MEEMVKNRRKIEGNRPQLSEGASSGATTPRDEFLKPRAYSRSSAISWKKTQSEFGNFLEGYTVEHIVEQLYYDESHGQSESKIVVNDNSFGLTTFRFDMENESSNINFVIH